MRSSLYYSLFLILFCPFFGNSQMLIGVVLDQKTQVTLPGATVYQDGTTNVTVTDENGQFTLDTKGLDNALMIRFIGYHTQKVDHPLQYQGKTMKLLLNEELFSLEEVVIGIEGPFTRREMLRVFREQFLGTSKAASRCKIVNEDDIILKYNVAKKALTATARKPLQIINNYLDYEVSFDLAELVVNYKTAESLNSYFINNSYFSGSTFYRDFAKNDKINQKRLEVFYGSKTHLIRSLAYGILEQENWELYVDRIKVNPADYFEITDTLHYKKIKLIKKPETRVRQDFAEGGVAQPNRFTTQGKIDSTAMMKKPTYFMPFYNRQKQSLMEFLYSTIYVDPNGNYTPIYGLVFGGDLGSHKAGDMLPIEYYQTIKEMQIPFEK